MKIKFIVLLLFCLLIQHKITGQENLKHNNKIETTFLSNCGFLLEIEGKKILLDPEDPEKSFYKDHLNQIYKKMLNNEPPYNNIDVLLISHQHPDHFAVNFVTRLLEKSPSLSLYTTSDVKNEIKKNFPAAFEKISNEIVAVDAFDGRECIIDYKGLKIEFLGTYHAGAPNYICRDLCFVITVEGRTIFYMSDIDPGYKTNYELITKWSKKGLKTDILFAPDVVMYENAWSSRQGIDAIKEFIRPGKIIATHLDPNKIKESKEKVKQNFKDVVFPEITNNK